MGLLLIAHDAIDNLERNVRLLPFQKIRAVQAGSILKQGTLPRLTRPLSAW